MLIRPLSCFGANVACRDTMRTSADLLGRLELLSIRGPLQFERYYQSGARSSGAEIGIEREAMFNSARIAK
jgi:hypothetical protein